MTTRNLNHIFSPSSVALLGADLAPATVEGVLTNNLLGGGFKGEIFPVSSKHKTIGDLNSYPDIASLPQTPDLAIIARPGESVPELIAELGQRGTRAAVIITPGSSKSDDTRNILNKAMLAASKPHLLRLVGPNSLGVMVPAIGLNGSFGHIQPLAGNLAFVTQSASVLTTVLDWATSKKIGFSQCISLGDMADVDFGDMLDYLTNDYKSRAILLYIESITHVRKFMSAARAAARIKPVIVVKAGRHNAINRVTTSSISEIQSLFTPDAIYDAAFRRTGMLRVADMQALFDAVQTLAMSPHLAGERLAIVTNSGTMGLMATDILLDRGGRLAELSPETFDILNSALPSTWSQNNPVDILGDAQDSRCSLYGNALEPLLNDKGVDAVLAINCPSAIASSAEAAQTVINTLQKTTSKFKPKVLLTCWMGEASAQKARRIFSENKVATYATPSEAVRGFMQIVRFRKSQEMLLETPATIPESFTPDSARAQQLIDRVLAENRAWMTESETQALLAAYAIPVVETGESPSTHAAAELVIGMVNDLLFGPVILFGHGGIEMEVIGDKALALPPLNMHLAHEVMARTRIYDLLHSSSEREAVQLDSIALTLVKISQLVCDIADIAGLIINPLLAHEQGVTVQNARIKIIKSPRSTVNRLAILPYPKELEESLNLPDGQNLLIRPIRPEDEPNFQKIFESLSPDEIRMRFLHPMKIMPHSMAARLTQIDYDREMAFVVEGQNPAGETELYGVVQIIADPNNERAEYAILLSHDMTGLGLGPMLLRRIINYAGSRGISEIFGEVLSENKSMLKLCRVFGFEVKSDREDPGIMQVSLKL